MSKAKRCYKCKKVKSTIKFSVNMKTLDGFSCYCKQCFNSSYCLRRNKMRQKKIFSERETEELKQRSDNEKSDLTGHLKGMWDDSEDVLL